MAYRAPAEGFGAGLERGINIGQKLFVEPEIRRRREAEHAEDRQVALEDRKRRIEREDLTQARTDDVEALKLLDVEMGDIDREVKGIQQKYGRNVPPEVAAPVGARYRAWQGKRDEVLERARSRVTGWSDSARKTAANLAAGQPVAQVSDKDFVSALAAGTGFDPEVFLGNQIEAMADLVVKSGESGDMNGLTQAANFLLQPELKRGVGRVGKDGTVITSKEIERFVPAPGENGGNVFPVIRVRTVGNPDGYLAPVTLDRTSDPDDPAIPVSVEKLMERLGQLSTLATSMKHPEAQAKIRGGMAGKNGEEIRANLEAYARLPGSKRKTTTHDTPLGNKVLQATRDAETGELVGERYLEKGIDPAVEERLKVLEREGGLNRANRVEIVTTQQTGANQRNAASIAGANQRNAASIAGANQRAAARGGGGTKLTKDEQEKIVVGEARQYGIFRHRDGWKQWQGTGEPGQGKGYWKDLSPESMDKLAKIQSDVAKRSKPNAPGVGGIPKAAAPAPARPAAGPARIANDAEYDALAPGTAFIGPDGVQRRKP